MTRISSATRSGGTTASALPRFRTNAGPSVEGPSNFYDTDDVAWTKAA